MVDNIILISSVINIPLDIPWSYSKTRSVFNREERYNQLKKTIISVKKKIPNNKILLVECSEFTSEEKKYLKKECDFIVNLWDRPDLHQYIFSNSKSLGFGLMIIEGIKFLNEINLNCKQLIKMGGRYWLNDDFNYEIWDNDKIVVNKIRDNLNNIQVGYFKIPFHLKDQLNMFLLNNIYKMKNCIGFEVLFSEFIKKNITNVKFIDKIGMEGYVSVCGSFWKN